MKLTEKQWIDVLETLQSVMREKSNSEGSDDASLHTRPDSLELHKGGGIAWTGRTAEDVVSSLDLSEQEIPVIGRKKVRLTEEQEDIIHELRRQDCHFAAITARESWGKGKTAYLDSRTSVQRVRRRFNAVNDAILKANRK